MDLTGKLLSHRLRGFGTIEHSPSAFDRATASQVPYLEVDTRVSSDGAIYLHHNHIFKGRKTRYQIATTASSVLNQVRYANGESLLSLKDALARYAARRYKGQRLCIDIKDNGYEAQHLDLVRRYALEDSVYFISWMPQSILNLHALGAACPLFLSYWSVFRLGSAGRMINWLLKDLIVPLKPFAILGQRRIASDLGALKQGYQHTLISQELPEELAHVLAATRGGICLHHSMIHERLISYCRHRKLQLWIFSVANTADYLRYAERPDIDVIFCDNAPLVMKELTSKESTG